MQPARAAQRDAHHATNALRIGDRVIYAAESPETAERLAPRGIETRTVDASELAKAEGTATCCSLVSEE